MGPTEGEGWGGEKRLLRAVHCMWIGWMDGASHGQIKAQKEGVIKGEIERKMM